MQLSEFISRKVTILMRDLDDFEGTLIGIGDMGYFLKDDSGTIHYIPDNNNVVSIDCNQNNQ